MANDQRNEGNADASGRDRFTGCLLGGAVGDALGAPVEFDGLAQIRTRFGPAGIQTYAPAYGRVGAITDDTQLTLFTAEGLIRGQNRMTDRGLMNLDAVLHRAYERWLLTQVGDPGQVPWDPEFGDQAHSGWLIEQRFLHSRRAPGNTCLGSLQHGYRLASPDDPINDSKGCGGVMRVAPVGLVAGDPFDVGCRAAALTHGHPNGWLAAGAFADMVSAVLQGASLTGAVQHALERLDAHDRGAETASIVRRALDLAATADRPDAAHIESIGEGWVAEEALAISVYCALATESFPDGVVAAVNHSGDSDSTGAITGNLLGVALGVAAIDADLLDFLEGRDVIQQVAEDLYNTIHGGEPDYQRYPPF